ncbi:MAG: ATP-binding protein [Candidatus Hinthialibacter antarcticus]|nr:ATP-binding protein [Candidatus Hinthialibacter antarcticus]
MNQQSIQNRSQDINENVILSAIGEGSSDAITRIDANGIITSWTPGAERMLGYSTAEIIGQHVDRIIPEENREATRISIQKQMQGKFSVLHEETERLHKDGRLVPVFLTRVPLHNNNCEIASLLAILKDTSEEKKLQKQVERLQRDTAMGKVAAKVAHEIRTPLGVLFLKSDLLVERMEAAFEEWGKGDASSHHGKLDKCVADIQKQISRLEEIATNYLHLSKSRTMERQRIDLRKWMKEMLKELQEQYPQGFIDFKTEYDEESPIIDGDPQQLQRVVANLVRNSVEAIQYSHNKKGTILLRSRPVDDGVMLEVVDDGPGMSHEISEDIFDPFITTKSIGTGLGLYLVREIIDNHGGSINIDTEEGQGTAVRIFLPALPKESKTL